MIYRHLVVHFYTETCYCPLHYCHIFFNRKWVELSFPSIYHLCGFHCVVCTPSLIFCSKDKFKIFAALDGRIHVTYFYFSTKIHPNGNDITFGGISMHNYVKILLLFFCFTLANNITALLHKFQSASRTPYCCLLAQEEKIQTVIRMAVSFLSKML